MTQTDDTTKTPPVQADIPPISAQEADSSSSQSDNPYADLLQGNPDENLVYNITKGGNPDDSDDK